MKLKKVISLVLGGVMALSMLTACGSDDTTTSAAAAAVASTATSNTTVVDYAIEVLNAASVAAPNVTYNTNLKGNEDADLASAVKTIKKGTNGNFGDPTKAMIKTIAELTAQGNYIDDPDTSYVIILTRDTSTGEYVVGITIGEMLIDAVVDVESVSVFEAELDMSTTVVGSAGGTTFNSSDPDEYWIIVITTK